MIGILNPELITLNWLLVINKFHLWRLITCCFFLGKFSFNFLFQLYFWVTFSSKLENNELMQQPGDYVWFLLIVIVLLCVISLLLAWPVGLPMLGPSLIFAVLYYWSRREPYAELNMMSFAIKGYQFPFVMMMFTLLMGGSIWGDLLGLAAGHVYYFCREIMPQTYGINIISTPGFLARAMVKYQPQAPGAPPPVAPQRPLFQGGGQRLGGN